MPTWGKFSDIWGRKLIILIANAVFLVGSLIAALSKDIGMLLAGRTLQGIGGGGLIVLPNICIADMFSQRYGALILSITTANVDSETEANILALLAESGVWLALWDLSLAVPLRKMFLGDGASISIVSSGE